MPGNCVRRLLTCEVVSSSEWLDYAGQNAFQPRVFNDVTAFMTKKLAALQCYDIEMRAFPHARSAENVEALAKHRGASVGVRAAEAFGLIWEIDV